MNPIRNDGKRALRKGVNVQCVICKKGTLHPKESSFMVEIGKSLIIFRHVPAQVCDTCGEVYFDEETSEKILNKASQIASSEVEVDIRDYKNVA